VLLQLGACPALRGAGGRAGQPPFHQGIDLDGIAGKDEVAQPEDAARSQHASDPPQRDRFPEIGQMVQDVAGIDDVGRLALVLVREKPPLHDLQVAQSRCFRTLAYDRHHRG
jgi:hypothetical protein